VIFASSKARFHAAGAYGVTILYSNPDELIVGAGGCPVFGITAEGTAVITMLRSRIIVAPSTDIEKDANLFAGFDRGKSVLSPF